MATHNVSKTPIYKEKKMVARNRIMRSATAFYIMTGVCRKPVLFLENEKIHGPKVSRARNNGAQILIEPDKRINQV